MRPIQRVIMVDDDPCSHLICKANIRCITAGMEFQEFTSPKMGIEYIENAYAKAEECTTVLLLDINMPGMDGWEFLEKYDGIENAIKNQITVFLI